MGYTLKLSVYCFSLRPLNKKKTENIGVAFSRLFGNPNLEEVSSEEFSACLKVFKDDFFSTFGNKFEKNDENTKAISIQSIDTYINRFSIDGIMIGGPTGIDQVLYSGADAKSPKNKIKKNDITTLSYYYKIWVPRDADFGLLMVQSYTEIGITNLFLNKLQSFFRTKGYTIKVVNCIPNSYKEAFLRRSVVQKLTVTKGTLSKNARKGLCEVVAEEEKVKIKIEISGFNVSIKDVLGFFSKKRIEVPELEIGEGYGIYDTIATYVDSAGRQSQAKMSKNFDFTPTIILDDAIKEAGSETPDLSRIRIHTDSILEELKVQIGYKPL